MADLPPSVALGTVRSTYATGASRGLMRWSHVHSDIPRLMVSRTLRRRRGGRGAMLSLEEVGGAH